MELSLFALSGLLIATSSGVMAFIMFAIGRSHLHNLWGFFCISVLVWGVGGFLIGTTTDPDRADLWWRIAHIGVAFIPTLFLHFVYSFLELKRSRTLLVFYALSIIFSVLAVSTDLLIAHMRLVFGEFYYDSPPGLLYPLFTTFFFGMTIYSHLVLFQNYRKHFDFSEHIQIQRARIRYFFLGMLISFAGGSMSFLPVYGIDLYPITNFAVIIYPIIIGYAILKLQLFDIRVATAQGLMFLVWIFAGIRFILSPNVNEYIINGALLGVLIVLGIFLVRSVSKEIKTREHAEQLAKDLEKANARLKELDKLKSEFVSIASHQLRSPLTAIKGYASLLLEGSFGQLAGGAKEAIAKIFESSKLMVLSVEDFLNVSRIEQGKMKYDMSDFSIVKVAKDVTQELLSVAQTKGLKLSFGAPREDIFVHADLGKLKQVIANLVDNAIKYTPQGTVDVKVIPVPSPGLAQRDGLRMVRIAVTDSGVGISKETMERLFDKFVRAANANEVNVSGTGLGLYIAKQLLEAQGGKIWAESTGEGKGSTFFIELPIKPS